MLEVQAKQLNDEARHLRSLKQCIQVGAVRCVMRAWAWSRVVKSFTHGGSQGLQASSNELKEQDGMRVSAGAAGTSASSRAALRSSLDAVARAVAAAHSAASALPRTPTAAWGEPSDSRCVAYIATPVYEVGFTAFRRLRSLTSLLQPSDGDGRRTLAGPYPALSHPVPSSRSSAGTRMSAMWHVTC